MRPSRNPPGPQGSEACPECRIPGEVVDERRYGRQLYECLNGECGVIEFDDRGGVHHMVSDPGTKEEVVDDPSRLW